MPGASSVAPEPGPPGEVEERIGFSLIARCGEDEHIDTDLPSLAGSAVFKDFIGAALRWSGNAVRLTRLQRDSAAILVRDTAGLPRRKQAQENYEREAQGGVSGNHGFPSVLSERCRSDCTIFDAQRRITINKPARYCPPWQPKHSTRRTFPLQGVRGMVFTCGENEPVLNKSRQLVFRLW